MPNDTHDRTAPSSSRRRRYGRLDVDPGTTAWLMGAGAGDRALGDDLTIPSLPAWAVDAACAGMPTSRFVGNAGWVSAGAVEVCAGCPVRDDCLEYALANPELYTHGVFGGLTPAERRTEGKARGLATSPRPAACGPDRAKADA